MYLLDAHPHNAVVRINHALEADASLTAEAARGGSGGACARQIARGAAGLAGGTAAGFIAAVATGTGARGPGLDIALEGTLHDGRVVDAHAGADGAALEAEGVEVVFAAALAVDAAGDVGGGGQLRAAVVRGL